MRTTTHLSIRPLDDDDLAVFHLEPTSHIPENALVFGPLCYVAEELPDVLTHLVQTECLPASTRALLTVNALSIATGCDEEFGLETCEIGAALRLGGYPLEGLILDFGGSVGDLVGHMNAQGFNAVYAAIEQYVLADAAARIERVRAQYAACGVGAPFSSGSSTLH